jgi:DnaJ-class molecular chaperone
MKNLYRILEVENFAPMDVVTRSFHRLVMLHHPDRGGDQEMMKQINSAYDDLKRYKVLYDMALRECLRPAPVIFTVVMAADWGY